MAVGAAICAWLFASYGAQAQNLFATGNSTIYQFTPAGVESTFTSATDGDGPAFGPNGNLFVPESDSSGNILEYTTGGVQSTFTSQGGDPVDLAFNLAGILFEADHNGNIFEYTSAGVQSTFATGLSVPTLMAFNTAGDLFVAGGNQSGYIYEYTPAGARSTFTTQVNNPLGLAFNSAGDLFEADANSGDIYEFTPAGVRSTFATGLPDVTALAFDQSGNLFAGDPNGIYKITANGTESLFSSQTGVVGLAFQNETLPVPEPSAYALFGIGLLALIVRLRNNAKTARA